ncbi:MAG: class I SAM-dependent methyltransferase [Vulcanimicrobiaceae bacterium]
MTEPRRPNADEIEYWNAEAASRWTALYPRTDALFAEITAAALDYASPQTGEHVLDVGCGCGATVLELVRRVGPGGRVVGIDVSTAMLGVAAERVRAARCANVELLLTDASMHPFEPATFQLAFSRFGVMFFDDPVSAFANIRRALRPGGRLVFISWRRPSENPWLMLPFAAAKPHLPPQPPRGPDDPGPFAFADPDRVRHILEAAGFTAVELDQRDVGMRLGGPGGLDAATEFAALIGPASAALDGAGPGARAAAKAAIHDELGQHVGPDGIVLPGSVWFVAARA